MIDLSNIRSLSDFQRNTKQHLKQLKKTGAPEVLTVNGQAEIVVQSAEGYQKLMQAADLNESVQVLRERLEAVDAGQKSVSAKRVLAEVRAKLGLSKR